MSLESATYVADLDQANPASSDFRHQGDDHLRMIKAALKATFPSATSPRYFWSAEASVAGADGTTDVFGAASERIEVSGTGHTITSFGTGANRIRYIRFSGASNVITHNGTSLACPGEASLTVLAGDTLIVVSDASSNARIWALTRAAALSQPLDADLTALAALDSTAGLLVKTGAAAYSRRTITGTANQISVADGAGAAANPTLSLPATVVIPGDIQVPHGGLQLIENGGSNYAKLIVGTNLTGNRNWTLDFGDANRTLDITAGNVTISAFGGTLVDDANAAAARVTLGVVIGTDVQAQDAELAALAGLVSAADRLPYFTGSGAAALATFTAAGRALVDDADASAQLTTLGFSSNGKSLVAAADYAAMRGLLDLEIGTDLQAYDADLAALAALDATTGLLVKTAANTYERRTLVGTANQITVTNGDGVAGAPTISMPSTMIAPDNFRVPYAGLQLFDNGASNYANILVSVDLTGNRNWSLNFGDANRSLDISAANVVISAYGATLVDDADAAAARTTLGLVIGTNVQAYDADLTTLGAGGSSARTFLGLAIGTDVQAYDAELAALAGLTSAADKVPYFTGAGTAAVTTLSSFIRTLLDDGDAATARATLGVSEVGSSQPADAELTALAGLVSAADQLPYFTGSTTAALTTLTAFGRSLIDDADAAAARTTLGLVIGTNVQAYDAELAALAGVTSAADALPYFTGSGTATTTTLTTFGRSLIDDANATAGRVTLGVVIGTNVQAYDDELAALAGLSSAADRLPYFTGSATAALAVFTAAGRAILDDADATTQLSTLGLSANGKSLVTAADYAAIKALLDLEIGIDVQAYDADLTTLGAGGAGARTFLGLVIGTDVQAYDVELAALAGLTSAADRLPYYTGSGTAALAPFTAFARGLVDDADATAARVTLGLVLGTNVVAYTAELNALGSLTSAADTVPYFTGSGTANLATLTTFARSLLDDTTAAAARATLGLAATTTDNAISRYDSTVGVTQNSGVLVTDTGGLRTGPPISLADDTATFVQLDATSCLIAIDVLSTPGTGAPTGLYHIRPAAGTIAAMAFSTVTNVTIGASQDYTGTTGTDGQFTIAVNSGNNKLWFENRSGAVRNISITIITAHN